MIAATVLSAGVSSRMGHPKALLDYRGKTFLQSILDASGAVGLRPRLVVVGPDGDKILAAHDLSDVAVVETTDFAAGPIGSIRAALDIVQDHPVDGILVWPVDQPHVRVGTVEALLDGFRAGPEPIVVPRFEGRRGHPVIFGRAVWDALRAAPADEGARAVVRADPGRVRHVDVADPAVVEDLNTPEAYRGMVRRGDERR